MKPSIAPLTVLAVLTASVSAQAAPLRVWHDKSHVFYAGADGKPHAVRKPAAGVDRDPAASPDGRRIAFIHFAKAPDPGEVGRGELMVFDVARGHTMRAAPPHASQAPGRDFTKLHAPTFSNDGRTIYVMAMAWVTSDSIHAVNPATHTERFVVGGNSLSVIRNGPYAGDLLVSEHRYFPGGGSYDPTFVVRPNGHEVLMVPGTDGDGDDEAAVAAWLKKGGWRAD